MLHVVNETFGQPQHHFFRNLKAAVSTMRVYWIQEMGYFLLIYFFHASVVRVVLWTGIRNVGQSVAHFYEWSIGGLPYALIVFFASTFSPSTPLVVRQGVDNLGSHQCLLFLHHKTGRRHHVIIRQPGILNTIVVVTTEEHGDDIILTGTYQMTEIAYSINNHIKMIAIRMITSIQLVDAAV